jgi:hypothetical protein
VNMPGFSAEASLRTSTERPLRNLRGTRPFLPGVIPASRPPAERERWELEDRCHDDFDMYCADEEGNDCEVRPRTHCVLGIRRRGGAAFGAGPDWIPILETEPIR